MTFTIPTAVHLMQTDHTSDARARGNLTASAPASKGTKVNGSLPLTGSNATQWRNGSNSGDGTLRGIVWEFLATGGYNVSSDTRLMIINQQFNAPNRVEIDTKANDGYVARIYSGSGSPPTNYKHFQIGGNDTGIGKARENPKSIIIDLNDTSHDSSGGTFSNTDVQCLGIGTVQAHLGGTNNLNFHQRMFVFETTKNATNIPRFTGTSDWDDIITAMGTAYNTKITDDWIRREGTIFSYAAPFEIGNNSTETDFNDNGVSVFWPNHNDPADPRVRVTSQAFRAYLNLRNNSADTATFSGFYDAGNSYPPWDFDQDDAAVVTFNNPTFKRTGVFKVGSSITGPATWDDCDVVDYQDNGVDLDGSTFKNPQGNYLVSLVP